jgi:tetratricopeptide (TPR) repeat protein
MGSSEKKKYLSELAELRERYEKIKKNKPQERGYALEKLFVDLMKISDIPVQEPFKIVGEQIDGTIKYEGHYYLIELKWVNKKASETNISNLYIKANGKLESRGLFIAMKGFSEDAIYALTKGKKLKVLILDGKHFENVIYGKYTFPGLLEFAISEASSGGDIYCLHEVPEDKKWILLKTTIEKEEEVVTPLPPAPYFAHPYPLQENFTGRLAEREALTEWFTEGDCPMFVYEAIGGMGKSALTWYWLQEDIIKKGLAPEGILWWSFYEKDARFETFLDKAIQYVSNGKTDGKAIPSTWEKMETLKTLLSQNRFLLVLDGVERVLRAYAGLGSPYQGDEVKKDDKQDFRACIEPNIGTFLQWLAVGNIKTKTLLTTRLCPKELDNIDGCFCKHLTKMNNEDAVDFFHRQGVKGSRAEIENVCDKFGYHPLSLRLLSGMIVKDPEYQGDVNAWVKHNPLTKLEGKEHHNILELAYNSLDKKKQTLISKLSAFRNPMNYESIVIFNEFGNEKDFDDALIELVDRGLLFRDEKSNKYDLHPIVRKYCYDRLLDKTGVHSQLRNYFAKVPPKEKIETLNDLAPVIELYHHTVKSGKYDEAIVLFRDRIHEIIYYQFGAYNLIIELLLALFPDGEDKPSRLKKESDQAWILNALANSYSLSGQPKKAIRLLEIANEIDEKRGAKKGVAVGLDNLADDQMRIGNFKSAESNLLRSIELCREIKAEFGEAVGHQGLGSLFVYQGEFDESEKELTEARKYFEKIENKEWTCLNESYHSIRALFLANIEEALNSAKKARDLADVHKLERNIIGAEWLLGAAHFMNKDFNEAEKHLD